MTVDQIAIFAILAITMALFISNRWRYDVVAGCALLAGVFSGVVPTDHAFEGFSHPAVVTVACVLVISQALQSSGVVELFLRYLAYARRRFTTQIAANCGVTALLSAFMNNIGALALMMPITMRDAQKANRSPSVLLMPLSFASLLGGLITLIGTPPNIVIATFRANNMGESYHMFDFAPVGLAVAGAGIAFLVLVGWRLLPARLRRESGHPDEDHFQLASYMTEVRIPEASALAEGSVRDLEALCEEDVTVIAYIRDGRRRVAPPSSAKLYSGDVLILEGHTEALQPLFENPGLVEAGAEVTASEWLNSPDVRVIEAVVMPDAAIEGHAMRSVHMHQRYGVNLLAVSRESGSSRVRLKHVKFRVGDVLLLQGEPLALEQMCKTLGCLGIKNRGFEITRRRGTLVTPLLFGAGIIAAAAGVVPVHIAFVAVVGALILLNLISLRDTYRSIEWPVIVLLGFLIPVGEALQTTGATDLIADLIVDVGNQAPIWLMLAILIGVSMVLSDLVHNTPTAVLMAPIAFSLANGLGLPPDPFLMAVAIGAASPYLTPIGHQSNTLVLGPGGYQFGDYWRLGLPLDIVIICVAVPMIMLVWL